ncbi:oxygenase MpaB family protein [Tomitella gaofuii]|uniref:oxygenase MpaB family protein n=1 Tax=Tomitella gaofuii TaxID=2760083 RepID=UPI0015FE2AC4|nr:oxygenase MpaB family protein [Tomitella gaofuii]
MGIRTAPGAFSWLPYIRTLDPQRDRHEIHRLTAGFEFPFDYQRALEFALFRTYCVPSISAVLAESGEFAARPQKRYDDTAILMAEMVEHGVDSERGHESVRNINRMHGMYDIANDDMLYVLSTFIYDPIDWIDRYGWRRLDPVERLAAYHYYAEIGRHMAIRDIPADYESFARFKLDYERDRFRYADTNNAIGRYTRDLYCSWFPAPLRPLVARGVYAMLDQQMSDAFGFPAGSPRLRALIEAALHARSAAVRFLPRRRVSRTTRDPRNRTYPGYPGGYRPRDLGVERAHGRARRHRGTVPAEARASGTITGAAAPAGPSS